MRLKDLRNYIYDTARQDGTCSFVDSDEREFSTHACAFVTGEVLVSYGFLDRKTLITLVFSPNYENEGVLLSRDSLLFWLDNLADEYGGDIPVRIRLYNTEGDHRDMLTDRLWGQILLSSDGDYYLTDGCSKRPFEYTEEERRLSNEWGACL